MVVEFNHTIIWARDSKASARFLAEILGLPAPVTFGPFEVVTTGLLPPALRESYGMAWGRGQQRAFRLAVAAVPRVVALTPPLLRVWPLPGKSVKLATTS